ncbi:MAG: dienelactone hydrolase family protein, partial [Pseudomonadota bacterium]
SLRAALAARLGPGYPGPGFARVEQVSAAPFGDWVLETLRCTDARGEMIAASLLRPPDGHPPVPGVIYAHAHGNRYAIGREELTAGRPALQGPYAPDLYRLGIAALCLDMPAFGARQVPGEAARAKAELWHGSTLFGRMLGEQRAAIDVLVAHGNVDRNRIGALGFSMGGTLALWLGAMDTRVRATVALGAFADLGTLIAQDRHDWHGVYMVVPGLLEVARTGQIAGLVAPRDLFIGVGLHDPSTPDAAFQIARDDVEAAFGDAGTLVFHVGPDVGHEETPAMRAAVLSFLARALAG